MKSEKTVSMGDYRRERHGRGKVAGKGGAGILLPSSDRLWELLDRNISLGFWMEHH